MIRSIRQVFQRPFVSSISKVPAIKFPIPTIKLATGSTRRFGSRRPPHQFRGKLLIAGGVAVSAGFLFKSKKQEEPTTSRKVIHLFLIGPGLVGEELVNQIQQRSASNPSIEVRVVGLANSRFMHFNNKGIALESWKDQLAQSNVPMNLQTFIDKMVHLNLPNSVFVDCTSSETVAEAYGKILKARIAIATPNKKANSGPLSTYSDMKKLATQNQVKLLYDATVGAGLPVIHTVQAMKRAGDTIVKIEGVLSGTLSYLFNTFDGTMPFSQLVLEAQKKGYTEPDPRDDLNAMDMARKFLILARESGLNLEMGNIVIKPFLTDDCFKAASVAEFYQKLALCDDQLSAMAKQAKQNGQRLRFTGTLEENGQVTLSLKAVGPEHPFYALSGTDNIVSISSHNYSKNPVVIKGPGAGAKVTAASVLSNAIAAGSS